MTELRQRMIDAMVQRGFAASTQDIDVSAIRRMAKHYRRDPALCTVQEVQAYLLHLVKDEKLSYSSMNQAACAMQFLFQIPVSGASPVHGVSELVSGGAGDSPLDRPDRAGPARAARRISAAAPGTVQTQLGGLCQAAVGRTGAGAGVSEPLHAPHGRQQ